MIELTIIIALKLKMYYQCPNCLSMKKPKIMRYFPPIIVKCLDCDFENSEEKFMKEDKSRKILLH